MYHCNAHRSTLNAMYSAIKWLKIRLMRVPPERKLLYMNRNTVIQYIWTIATYWNYRDHGYEYKNDVMTQCWFYEEEWYSFKNTKLKRIEFPKSDCPITYPPWFCFLFWNSFWKHKVSYMLLSAEKKQIQILSNHSCNY